MKYQLVLQFEATSTSDFDRLVAFEKKLDVELGDSSSVDGHDLGLHELNIFVLTDDPGATFQKASKLAKNEALKHDMRAAYREVTGDTFVVLWPPNLREFGVS